MGNNRQDVYAPEICSPVLEQDGCPEGEEHIFHNSVMDIIRDRQQQRELSRSHARWITFICGVEERCGRKRALPQFVQSGLRRVFSGQKKKILQEL